MPDEDPPDPDSLEALTRDLSRLSRTDALSWEPKCCCGRKDAQCEYLRCNWRILEQLEEKGRMAGKAGKVLLETHANAMAEAESEKRMLTAKINHLEEKDLQAVETIAELERQVADLKRTEKENKDIVAESKAMLQSLEELKANMKLSETRVFELEQQLDYHETEYGRVLNRSKRADDLEAAIAKLEAERFELENAVVTTKAQARTARERWKATESRFAELELHYQRLVEEYKAEQKKAERAELVEKLAITENMQLQTEIDQLRKMLEESQNEARYLRERLNERGGLPNEVEIRDIGIISPPLTADVGQPPTVMEYHHYQKVVLPRPRSPRQIPRPRRRRGRLSSEPASATRTTTVASLPASPSAGRHQRWSIQSKATTASSTASTFRDSAIFDRTVDDDEFSSRPTSAGSECPTPSDYKTTRFSYASVAPIPILQPTQEEAIHSDSGSSFGPTLRRTQSYESMLGQDIPDPKPCSTKSATTITARSPSFSSSMMGRRAAGPSIVRGSASGRALRGRSSAASSLLRLSKPQSPQLSLRQWFPIPVVWGSKSPSAVETAKKTPSQPYLTSLAKRHERELRLAQGESLEGLGPDEESEDEELGVVAEHIFE